MNPANKLTIDNSKIFVTLFVFLLAMADKTMKMRMGAIKIRTKIKPTLSNHNNWFRNILKREHISIIMVHRLFYYKKVGYTRINIHSKELSIAIKSKYQNKGIGTIAVNLLPIKPLQVIINKNNFRSIHFFNKNKIHVYIID